MNSILMIILTSGGKIILNLFWKIKALLSIAAKDVAVCALIVNVGGMPSKNSSKVNNAD